VALSAIDDNAVLIVLDLQVATAGMPTTPYAAAHIFERSAGLAKAFRDKGLPVVWVNVAGGSSGRTETAPQMGGLAGQLDRAARGARRGTVRPDIHQVRVGRLSRRTHGLPC